MAISLLFLIAVTWVVSSLVFRRKRRLMFYELRELTEQLCRAHEEIRVGSPSVLTVELPHGERRSLAPPQVTLESRLMTGSVFHEYSKKRIVVKYDPIKRNYVSYTDKPTVIGLSPIELSFEDLNLAAEAKGAAESVILKQLYQNT